jgi:hypothetical protein
MYNADLIVHASTKNCNHQLFHILHGKQGRHTLAGVWAGDYIRATTA